MRCHVGFCALSCVVFLLSLNKKGLWAGNVLKFGGDDGCTTINIIKFTELKKRKQKQKGVSSWEIAE